MAAESTTELRVMCPSCGKKGRRVSSLTVRSLLKDDLCGEVIGDNSPCSQIAAVDGSGCHPLTDNTGYRFCDSPKCDVVYFQEAAGGVYTKSQLTVPVGVKETTGDRPLCYCFGHSVVTILAALFLFFPNYVAALLGTTADQTVTPSMTQTTIRIEGMTCEGCSAVVAKAIHKVPGVLAVEVDYEQRRAVVGTEACCPVPEDEVLAALKSAGYSGIIIETPFVLSPLDPGQAKQTSKR